MSDHVLLFLLNELGKRDKMRGLPSISYIFCTSLINVGFYLTHDIKILKTCIFSYFSQRYNLRPNVSQTSVNH